MSDCIKMIVEGVADVTAKILLNKEREREHVTVSEVTVSHDDYLRQYLSQCNIDEKEIDGQVEEAAAQKELEAEAPDKAQKRMKKIKKTNLERRANKKGPAAKTEG